MAKRYRYGRAYYYDEHRWRYTHNNEPVPGASVFIDPITGHTEMDAPELLIHQMLDIHDVAEMLGIASQSVSRLLARGDMPEPQQRVGQRSPLWTRPVIEHWINTRPGKGAHLRKRVA